MGLARWGQSPQDIRNTPYVQTRWYRAPEVVTLCDYGLASDMWSFGCIMAECYTQAVTFPGVDTVSQFVKIFEKLGTPDQAVQDAVPSASIKTFIQSLGTLSESLAPAAALSPCWSPVRADGFTQSNINASPRTLPRPPWSATVMPIPAGDGPAIPIATFVPGASDEALDLLSQLLVYGLYCVLSRPSAALHHDRDTWHCWCQ